MERQDPPTTPGAEGPADRAYASEIRESLQPDDPEQRPTAAQPSAGWGAPPAGQPQAAQQPSGQQSPGWGPQTTAQPSAGWGSPQASPPSAGWGTPPAAGQRTAQAGAGGGKWTLKKGLIAGGVAVVVAGATAAGVYAAGSNTAADAGTQGAGGLTGQGGMAQGGPGGGMSGGGFAPDGMGMGSGGLSAAVHSEYVILRDGTYVNMASQTGTVSAVSADSITVKSEDGFSRTYGISSDLVVSQGMGRGMNQGSGSTLSLSDVASGASVRITALQDSGNYTAETIQLVTTSSSGQGTGSLPGGDPNTSSN